MTASKDGLTRAELLALPVTVDVPTAARALGLGRSTAYELARRDEFPCRVLRVGNSYRIPDGGIRDAGLASNSPTPEEALGEPRLAVLVVRYRPRVLALSAAGPGTNLFIICSGERATDCTSVKRLSKVLCTFL